jgi:hypothetical protein
MIHGFGLSSLASILILGVMFQTGTPPRGGDPHADPNAASASGTCDDLVDYVETLFETLEEHDTFSDFWVAPDYDSVQQMDRADVEAIVDDGEALLDDLTGLTVPASYGAGHEGIQVILGFDVGYVRFLGIDASSPPDLDEWDRGMALILQGELTTANACPEEIAEIGNFVFYDPEDLETIFD